MSHVHLLSSVGRHFALLGGCLKLKDPIGTQYLSGRQRSIGVAAGSHIAQDSFADKIHRGASHCANARLRHTTQRAWQDGVLTRAERNQIHDARRDAGIARQRVGVDNYRRTYGRALKNACQDGKITPQERQRLRGMRGNLGRMQANLKRSVAHDRRMERIEGIQNKLLGNQVVGFNPSKLAQNLGFGCGTRPTVGHCGTQTLQRCGCPGGEWNVPLRQPAGHPRGSQYLSFGQRLAGHCQGTQLARTTLSDVGHRAASCRADASYRNTVKSAWSDGVLTLSERNAIRNAGREASIARTRVQKDDVRRAYGCALKSAVADGVITPQERQQLTRFGQDAGRLGARLNQLQAQDQAADRREAVQSFLAGNRVVGFRPAELLQHLLGAA